MPGPRLTGGDSPWPGCADPAAAGTSRAGLLTGRQCPQVEPAQRRALRPAVRGRAADLHHRVGETPPGPRPRRAGVHRLTGSFPPYRTAGTSRTGAFYG